MLNICFGPNDNWVGDITKAIDHASFGFQFCDLHLVNFTDFDCIVPLSVFDYDALQKNSVFNGKKFWCTAPNVVDICSDKLLLNRWLLGREFAELVPPLRQSTGGEFPYIVKKRRDVWGQNSFIVRNSEDERAMAATILSPEYFCQKYISGSEEFALHILMVNGEVAYARTVKHKIGRNYYVFGQNVRAKRSILVHENEHIVVFLRMLANLDYTGTCCIDYKIDNGLPMLLEVNPRFGASLTLDINNYLEAYLRTLGIVDRNAFRNRNISHTGYIERFLQSFDR